MRYISIGDLVTDYYYKNDKLIGICGGMSSHNIIANLAFQKESTKVFGVCGLDSIGDISIKSLHDLNVDTSDVKQLKEVKTRTFHISYVEKEKKSIEFKSKKRCPICNNKKWYEESLIDTKEILNKLEKDDILIFDNLNKKNQIIIDNCKNIKMLDLGQYFEFEKISNEEILKKITNKFSIINLNERVERYLLERFDLSSLLELYNLLNSELIIITRGKKGADFVFDNQVIHKELINKEEEIDSNGAGDAFFSVFIKKYIEYNKRIDENYINNAFLVATKLTSKVVKNEGARGHMQKLYKVKKITNECTCSCFVTTERKQVKRCNINVNNLEVRTLNAINSNAYEKLKKINFKEINNSLFIGTGGSFAGAVFASKVINNMYGTNTIAILPRDVKYRNNSNIDKTFLFSYSGTTNDLIECTKNIKNENKFIITKGEEQKIIEKTGLSKNNIITYRTSSNKGKERGFLAFEGAVAPAALFLKLYLENKNNISINTDDFIHNRVIYWNNYFDRVIKEKGKEILKPSTILNIFNGDFSSSAGIDLESKFIESGIFNCIIHEKKNFSHGRFINYENLNNKNGIYFKEKNISKYEEIVLNYLDKDNLIMIESEYSGILAEFDFLLAAQYLIYHISKYLDIDISKPKYSEEAMKIYFYKGDL